MKIMDLCIRVNPEDPEPDDVLHCQSIYDSEGNYVYSLYYTKEKVQKFLKSLDKYSSGADIVVKPGTAGN